MPGCAPTWPAGSPDITACTFGPQVPPPVVPPPIIPPQPPPSSNPGYLIFGLSANTPYSDGSHWIISPDGVTFNPLPQITEIGIAAVLADGEQRFTCASINNPNLQGTFYFISKGPQGTQHARLWKFNGVAMLPCAPIPGIGVNETDATVPWLARDYETVTVGEQQLIVRDDRLVLVVNYVSDGPAPTITTQILLYDPALDSYVGYQGDVTGRNGSGPPPPLNIGAPPSGPATCWGVSCMRIPFVQGEVVGGADTQWALSLSGQQAGWIYKYAKLEFDQGPNWWVDYAYVLSGGSSGQGSNRVPFGGSLGNHQELYNYPPLGNLATLGNLFPSSAVPLVAANWGAPLGTPAFTTELISTSISFSPPPFFPGILAGTFSRFVEFDGALFVTFRDQYTQKILRYDPTPLTGGWTTDLTLWDGNTPDQLRPDLATNVPGVPQVFLGRLYYPYLASDASWTGQILVRNPGGVGAAWTIALANVGLNGTSGQVLPPSW